MALTFRNQSEKSGASIVIVCLADCNLENWG